MAYPFDHRRDRPTTFAWTANLDPAEWRCVECGKLLGVRHGTRGQRWRQDSGWWHTSGSRRRGRGRAGSDSKRNVR